MQLLLTLFGLFGTAFGIYYICTCLGGFVLRRSYELPSSLDTTRIAAVIPARNEERVIAALIESLKAQDYPPELLDIYVVINNCSDDTEGAARRAGAQILRCTEPVSRKGDALRQAFEQLKGKYDCYCIFDADNLVHPKFMHNVNNAFCAGYDAAQGFRDSKNPFDSWVSGSTALFYWFMSLVFNESRARMGLSSHINGTGFMVSDHMIQKIGWETHTLTEDLEFTGLCALNDCRIAWMPEARVYDEQPITLRDSAIQRRRWTAGSMQCMWRYLVKLFSKANPCSIDIGMLFFGNTLNYMGIVSTILSVISYRSWAMNHIRLSLELGIGYVLIFWLVLSCGAALLFRAEGKLSKRSLPTILLFPWFMITWMPINLYAALTPPPTWRTVSHVRDISVQDIEAES